MTELASRERVRRVLDGTLDAQTKESVAETLGIEEDAARRQIGELSTQLALLPSEVFERLEAESRQNGESEASEAVLAGHRSELEEWWDRIDEEGQLASERITNSNLPLSLAWPGSISVEAFPFWT